MALQYCLQNLDRHRFGDVSPKAVEGDYARQGLHKPAYGYAYLALLSHAFHMHTRLAERLGQHAQIQKQTVLIKAVSALLKCDLESKQLEPHHNVLSLIYWLAQRPLDSPWMPDSEDDTETNSGTTLYAFRLRYKTVCIQIKLCNHHAALYWSV